MSKRTDAVIIIMVGVIFGLFSIFLSKLGFITYILLTISICLIGYGVYLYVNESRLDSN